jgi:hypothetical protein
MHVTEQMSVCRIVFKNLVLFCSSDSMEEWPLICKEGVSECLSFTRFEMGRKVGFL